MTDISRSHVLSGLLNKRAEIAGKIEYTHRTLNDLVADLDALDSAIRIIDPNCDVAQIHAKRYPPRMGFFRGEMSRFVLTHLRTATAPCSSLELALAVMQGRGLDTNDARSVSIIKDRVRACLWRQQQKGVVREVAYTGEYKRWEMVR